MIGRLDQQKVAVRIFHLHHQIGIGTRQFEQQKNDEPFVLNVLIEIGASFDV